MRWLLLTTCLLLTGCFGSEPSASDDPQGDSDISIADFAFKPGDVTIRATSALTWTNDGSTGHTVTAMNGAFDSGTLFKGDSFTFAFPNVGDYSYFCSIHPSMTGTITVTDV